MKNLLKIYLACLCLLFSGSVLKAQNCDTNISMSFEGRSETASHVDTSIKVTTSSPVYRIQVGHKLCTNASGITTCTGTFRTAKECAPSTKTLNCFVNVTQTCSARQDGCVVVIAGKACNGGTPSSGNY